jgi:hypothetical protein
MIARATVIEGKSIMAIHISNKLSEVNIHTPHHRFISSLQILLEFSICRKSCIERPVVRLAMRPILRQNAILEVSLYMLSNASGWTDNHAVTVATVGQYNTSFEPCAGPICMCKRCHRIIFSVDEQDLVPGLDALEATCEPLLGVDPPAG